MEKVIKITNETYLFFTESSQKLILNQTLDDINTLK